MSLKAELKKYAESGEADEGIPYFRVYAFKAGRVLSEQDVADIQQVLNEYNDEIGVVADLYHQAREQVLHEIGGEELVKAAAAADQAQSAVSVTRALKHYYDKVDAAEAERKRQN